MDTVYQAISALYDNPNANEKEKASVWLGDIQKSVSMPLLLPDNHVFHLINSSNVYHYEECCEAEKK